MSEHRVPVGRKTGGKYVEPVESVGNLISFKLTISANNKKFMPNMKNNKNNTTHKICAEFQISRFSSSILIPDRCFRQGKCVLPLFFGNCFCSCCCVCRGNYHSIIFKRKLLRTRNVRAHKFQPSLWRII